ncbi:hypothetical protein ACFQ3Z_04500 [Streptomyces nogalater]
MTTWEDRLVRLHVRAAPPLRRSLRPAPSGPGRRISAATPAERPESTAARRRLEAVTVWGVTQVGAAAHMKGLTDIIDTPGTTFEGWTDDLDIVGIHVFACSSISPTIPKAPGSGGSSPRARATARRRTVCISTISSAGS